MTAFPGGLRSASVLRAAKFLRVFGLALLVAALVDLVSTVVPVRLGNPSWEFAVLSNALSGLPLLVASVAFVLVGGAMSGRRWEQRLSGVTSLIVGLACGAALILFVLTVPVALLAVGPEPASRMGVLKVSVKTVWVGLVGIVALTGFTVWSFRRVT